MWLPMWAERTHPIGVHNNTGTSTCPYFKVADFSHMPPVAGHEADAEALVPLANFEFLQAGSLLLISKQL